MSTKEMLPLYQYDGERDDRFDGVILLDGSDEGSEDGKETAEDCGSYWLIRNWEIAELDGVYTWFCRSSYTIDKSVIAKLAKG